MSKQRILIITMLVTLVATGAIITIATFRPDPTVGTPYRRG